jgi:hypothetical protein
VSPLVIKRLKQKADREENWNSLERICSLLQLEPLKNQILNRAKVPNENFTYNIYTGSHIPSFLYIP